MRKKLFEKKTKRLLYKWAKFITIRFMMIAVSLVSCSFALIRFNPYLRFPSPNLPSLQLRSRVLLKTLLLQATLKVKETGNINEKIFSFLEFFGSTFLLGAALDAATIGIASYYFVSFLLNKKYH